MGWYDSVGRACTCTCTGSDANGDDAHGTYAHAHTHAHVHGTGVAPDHPDVKSVIHEFDTILADTRIHFYGNIHIGHDIHVSTLRQHYHAVILAYGAESQRTLGIPNAHLKGIHPARTFVAWYNGHPDAAQQQYALDKTEQVVVIGQGNVAVDVARMLLMPVDTLRTTDTTSYALDALTTSRVHDVHLVGRRGPVQSAFTIKVSMGHIVLLLISMLMLMPMSMLVLCVCSRSCCCCFTPMYHACAGIA